MTNDLGYVTCPKCAYDRNSSSQKNCEVCWSLLNSERAELTALVPSTLILIACLVIFGTAYFLLKDPLGNSSSQKPNDRPASNDSSQNLRGKDNLRLLGDTFSGYSLFRSAAFQRALKASGLNFQYVDEFDQAKRATSLDQGQADILVTTLDQFLKQKPAGKVVALIDRTVGADAVVVNTKQYPQLKSLLDLTKMVKESQGSQPMMTFAGDTASEYLALVLASKFEALKLSDFNVVKVKDASEAWEKMKIPQENIAIAVLWEPFVTQAQKHGDTVVLSSRDTPNTIVGVMVASDRLIQSQPKKISQLLETYYRLIDATIQDSSQLKQDISSDSQLSPTDAATVLKGINFFTSLEAQRWLTDGTLEKRLGSTAAVLVLAGKLDQVPAQPRSLYSDQFMKGATVNTQKLVDLVQASDPQLAARIAGTQSLDSSLQATHAAQIQSAPTVGNLAYKGQVGFETGSAQLTDEGQSTLRKLRQEIEEFSVQTIAVRIIGHTSKTGTSETNQDLSQRRAQVVVDYLRSLGLKHQIIAQGTGFSEPLAGLSPEATQNQRTEIRLVRIN